MVIDGIVIIAEMIWDILGNNSTAIRQEQSQGHEMRVYPGEECDRKCGVDEPARICIYQWVLENYSAMGS